MDRRTAIKNSALFAGLSISGASIASIFQSCQQLNRLDWKPQFFTSEQAQTVSAITEAILPKTETPGALDLKVDLFVDAMFNHVLSPEDQQHVMKGFEEFVNTTQDLYGKDFSSLSREEQSEVLRKVGEKTNHFNPSIWGSKLGEEPPIDFYRRVKQFTLIGYFTSEEIGKNVLVYDPIPTEFKGCIPVDDVGNAWTL